MKNFNRENLPESVKYNGSEYHYLTGVTGKKTILDYCQAHGYKLIQVNVLQRTLRHKRDLHGNFYKPSGFYFSAPKMPHDEVMKLTDLIRNAQ